MGVISLPKTVTRQRRGCNLNPGPSAPEFIMLTTRLPSHPKLLYIKIHTVNRSVLVFKSEVALDLVEKLTLR